MYIRSSSFIKDTLFFIGRCVLCLISPWLGLIESSILYNFLKCKKWFPWATVIQSLPPRHLNMISSNNELFLTLSTSEALSPLASLKHKLEHQRPLCVIIDFFFKKKAASGDYQPSREQETNSRWLSSVEYQDNLAQVRLRQLKGGVSCFWISKNTLKELAPRAMIHDLFI